MFEYATAAGDVFNGFVEYGIGPDLDCNGDGEVNAADLACACGAGIKDDLIARLGILEGDLDGNGKVEFADFLKLSANFGQAVDSYTDGDGTVAFADFLKLSGNFGKTAGGTAAAVPEPSGLTLICLSGLAVLHRRRRSSTPFK